MRLKKRFEAPQDFDDHAGRWQIYRYEFFPEPRRAKLWLAGTLVMPVLLGFAGTVAVAKLTRPAPMAKPALAVSAPAPAPVVRHRWEPPPELQFKRKLMPDQSS